MEDSHKAMIVYDRGGNKCVVFTCMQIASAIVSPANVHRLGKCPIRFFHEWIRGFLEIAGAKRHATSFLPSPPRKNRYCTTFLRKMLHDDGILPIDVEYKSPSEVSHNHTEVTKAKIGRANKGKGRKMGHEVAKETRSKISAKQRQSWSEVDASGGRVRKLARTEAELKILRDSLKELGEDWDKIAERIPGQSRDNVYQRWYRVERHTMANVDEVDTVE
jgi:hypothetical protein